MRNWPTVVTAPNTQAFFNSHPQITAHEASIYFISFFMNMLLCAPEKRFTQTHSRVCYFKINRSVREAEARVLIQALCSFAERSRIFLCMAFKVRRVFTQLQCTTPNVQCRSQLTSFCSFNAVCSLLLTWFITYLLPPLRNNCQIKSNKLNLSKTPRPKNDMTHHLHQTAVRINSDVIYLKKCYSKVQQRQQTTYLSLYLSNHQCCVNTMASAN